MWLLASLLVVGLRHVATQGRVLIKHGHRLGVVKQVHIMRKPARLTILVHIGLY